MSRLPQLAMATGMGFIFGIAACGPRQETSPATMTLSSVAAGDEVAVTMSSDTAIVEVRSPKGIGQAVMHLAADARPPALRWRFHLQGLEELRIEYDSTIVLGSVSSHAPFESRWSVQRRGAPAQNVESGSAQAGRVRLVPGPGAPAAIPLQGGRIEVEAPAALLLAQPATITIRWIDFYR
jgi:hypothetical protein